MSSISVVNASKTANKKYNNSEKFGRSEAGRRRIGDRERSLMGVITIIDSNKKYHSKGVIARMADLARINQKIEDYYKKKLNKLGDKLGDKLVERACELMEEIIEKSGIDTSIMVVMQN